MVIRSWLALQEYLATYGATCPGFSSRAVFGADQDAGVQLITEAHVDRLAVAGIALHAGSPGLVDRIAGRTFGEIAPGGAACSSLTAAVSQLMRSTRGGRRACWVRDAAFRPLLA
jgi:hypothetical protein